jgi:hypothetical protein
MIWRVIAGGGKKPKLGLAILNFYDIIAIVV